MRFKGKVVMKHMKNMINRQVTFLKRRQGILKKAKELAVVCIAEVAIIIILAKGKVFEYGNVRYYFLYNFFFASMCCYFE